MWLLSFSLFFLPQPDPAFCWLFLLCFLYWLWYVLAPGWETVHRKEEVIEFFPSLAVPTTGGDTGGPSSLLVQVHGRLFHPKTDDPLRRAGRRLLANSLGVGKASPEAQALFQQRIASFFVDNRRGKRISIAFLPPQQQRPRTGEAAEEEEQEERTVVLSSLSSPNGHFTDKVLLRCNKEAGGEEGEWIRFRSVPSGEQTRSFEGEALRMTGRGLSVISDIDDTIKVSHVADKKLLMQNTFMRPFEAVPGMARLYQRWRRIDLQGAEGGRAEEGEGEVRNGARYDEKAELEYKEAAEKKKEKDEDEELMKNGEKEAKQTTTRFHYVSGSPWQLCGLLKSFLEEKGFPKGSMHLRHFRIKDSSAVQAAWTPPYTFKQRAIEPLLQMFPERKFIFVGDSGEMDPEVYGDLARAYPNQVLAIFIRRAPENPKMVLKQREALQKEKEEEEARKKALAPKEKALIAENEQVKEAILTTIEETQEEQGRMADEKNNEAEKEMKEDEKKAEEIAKEMQEIEKGEEEAAKDTEQLQENVEEVKEIEQVTEEGSVEDKLNEESQAEEKTEDERNEKEGEVDDRAEREARRWQVTFRDLDKTLWQVFDNAEELFSVRLPDLFH